MTLLRVPYISSKKTRQGFQQILEEICRAACITDRRHYAASAHSEDMGMSGSTVIKIKGYAANKAKGNGSCLSSANFILGRLRWCILYYLDGASPDDAGWISKYVKFCDEIYREYYEVKAQFKITLMDHDWKAVPAHSMSGTQVFTSKVSSWGFNRFISCKDLEDSGWLKNDAFYVVCDITVAKETYTDPTNRHPVIVPVIDIQHDYAKLLNDPQGADVTFEVGDETFPAHRDIMASRSSVFKAKLCGSMKESRESSVLRIQDMEAKVFRAMLHFIYTDMLPPMDEESIVPMSQHLLVVADKYDLPRLKLICEKSLCSRMSADMAATTLALAERNNCPGLKLACFNFLKSPANFKRLLLSEGFKHLTDSCPAILEELAYNLPY